MTPTHTAKITNNWRGKPGNIIKIYTLLHFMICWWTIDWMKVCRISTSKHTNTVSNKWKIDFFECWFLPTHQEKLSRKRIKSHRRSFVQFFGRIIAQIFFYLNSKYINRLQLQFHPAPRRYILFSNFSRYISNRHMNRAMFQQWNKRKSISERKCHRYISCFSKYQESFEQFFTFIEFFIGKNGKTTKRCQNILFCSLFVEEKKTEKWN